MVDTQEKTGIYRVVNQGSLGFICKRVSPPITVGSLVKQILY